LIPALVAGVAALLTAGYLGRDTFRLRYWSHVAATDSARRGVAIFELGRLDDSSAVSDALASYLDHSDGSIRHGSALALGHFSEDLSLERLGPARYQTVLLTAKAAWIQSFAMFDGSDSALLGVSVGDVSSEGSGPEFKGPPDDVHGFKISQLREPLTPARLLLEERPEDLVGLVRALRTGPAASIRYAAAQALGTLAGQLPANVAAGLDAAARSDSNVEVRRMALRALLGFVNTGGTPRALDDSALRLCRSLLVSGPEPQLSLALAAARALAPKPGGDGKLVRRVLLEAITLYPDQVGFEDALLGMLCLSPDEALVEAFTEVLSELDPRASTAHEPLSAKGRWAVLHAIRDPDWIRETFVDGDSPRSAYPAVAGRWVRLASLSPERAMAWLLDPRAEQTREVVGRNLHPFLPFLRGSGLKQGELGAALARALTEQVDPTLPLLASICVELLVGIGGDAHVGALEAFARGGARNGPLDKERALAGRAAAILRRELPKELRQGAAAARIFLTEHLGRDGVAGADQVHPADHPCALQGNGIRHLEHRTPLACLALLSRDDAPETLGPSIRYLSDSTNDGLGYFRTVPTGVIPPHLLASSASVGAIPRALEESLVLWVLRRAIARGIEVERARAAIERRVNRLLAESIWLREQEFLVLGLAAVGDLFPPARERALAFRKTVDLVQNTTVISDAATPWLGPKTGYPALRRLSAVGSGAEAGDPWLSAVALTQSRRDPGARRDWLWRAVNQLSFERSSSGTCAGAVVPNAQEDPVILTAWNALACEAIESALSGR
jgi:hypothetical protein